MKKFLKIILSVVVTSSILISCSSDGGDTETSDTQTAEDIDVASANIGTEDSPVEVKMLMKDMDPTAEDIIAFVDVVEKNMAENGDYINIEVLEAPSGSYGEVVPLAVRTGQVDADLIYFQGGDQPLSNEGYFEDLTPYIESSENIKSIMQEHNEARLENYPYMMWLAPDRASVPVIREDIFNSLSTSEALLEDPNQENYMAFFNELAEDYDMVITADSIDRLDSVFEQSFGLTTSIVEEDGKYVYNEVTEGSKNKMDFYNEIFSDGILDNEIFTNTWDVAEAKFYDSKAAILIGTAGAVIDVYNTKMVSTMGDDAELVVLPPMSGIAQGYAPTDTSKESRGWTISATSGNEEKLAAFAILDYMASQEGRMIDLVGLEGIHYNIEDGVAVNTEIANTWWPKIWETTYNFEPEVELAEPVYSDAANDSLDKIVEYYTPDNNIILPDEYVASYDAMGIIYNDYLADVMKGNEDTSSFNEFVDEWNANGGDAISEYFETVMD